MKLLKNWIIGLIVIINLLMLITSVNAAFPMEACNWDSDCHNPKGIYSIVYPCHEYKLRCIENICNFVCPGDQGYEESEESVPPIPYPEGESNPKIVTLEKETAVETTPTSPMKIESSISKAPALNDITIITTIITYSGRNTDNIPKTIAQIILPYGFELVSGNLTWEGYVKSEPQQFSVVVKAIKTGNWTIKVGARSPPNGEEGYIGGGDNIYISVFKDKGIIHEVEFLPLKPEGILLQEKLNESEIPPEKENSINESRITPKPIEFIPDNKNSPIKEIFANIINFFKSLFKK